MNGWPSGGVLLKRRRPGDNKWPPVGARALGEPAGIMRRQIADDWYTAACVRADGNRDGFGIGFRPYDGGIIILRG